MKKMFATLLASFFVMAGFAQSSKIEGAWVQLNEDGTKIIPNVKCLLPDGRVIGLTIGEDRNSTRPWLLGTYEIVDDSTYIEHLTFHTSIAFQRDIKQSFKRLNDSILITTYINRYVNGIDIQVAEGWKKLDVPTEEFAGRWDESQQQALTMFHRVPPEGKSVEEYGDELYEGFKKAKEANDLDRACEILLVRAEMDTTNLSWQRDVMQLFLDTKALPAIADKIANRYVRLAEQQAPTPTDTSVVNAYRMRGFLYVNFGNSYMDRCMSNFEKSIKLSEASGRPYDKDDGVSFLVLAFSCLPQGEHEKMMEYSDKAIDIFEKAPGVSSAQKGEGYFIKAMGLGAMDKCEEAIDMLLHKAAPLLIDEQGKPLPKVDNEVYLYAFSNFGELFCQNPNDKKIVKEYKQFMKDKLLCGIIQEDKDNLLKGEYYIVEMNDWNIENTECGTAESNHFVIQKDGNHFVVDLKEGEKLGSMVIKTVDPSFKQQIVKNWKNFKKKK